MKLLKRGLDWPKNPGWMRYSILIGWIALILSGCAIHPLDQQGSNAGLGARDASVCRLKSNEAPAKGAPDRDAPHRHETRIAVGLTGLMGGVYAEALGVHQVSAGQSDAKQSEPGPDAKGCIG